MRRRKTALGGIPQDRYDALVDGRIINLTEERPIKRYGVFILAEGEYPNRVSLSYQGKTHLFEIISSEQVNRIMGNDFNLILVPTIEELVLGEDGDIKNKGTRVDRKLVNRLQKYAEMRGADFMEIELTEDNLERVCFKYLQEKPITLV